MNATSGDLPTTTRIYVAGHRGMVGAALCRKLAEAGYAQVLTAERDQLDLCDSRQVRAFFERHRPEAVFVAAARVGGIMANSEMPADFITDNLHIAINAIEQAHAFDVQRLIFLGSSCIYPRQAPQPIAEEDLLGGFLEASNEPYAIAKIAGVKLCEAFRRQHGCDFRSVMPCNLYGPGDNYHPRNSHVMAALIQKFCTAVEEGAPEVELWGSGTVQREFLHVADLADACLFLMQLPRKIYEEVCGETNSHINVGAGEDITIKALAEKIQTLTGYEGRLRWLNDMPDGTPRKLMRLDRIKQLGWQPRISLNEGLIDAIDDYQKNKTRLRRR